MPDKKYCVCCGEEVPFHTIERNERREVVCSLCGFPLEVEALWEAKESGNTIAFIAEDSEVVRKVLAETLAEKHFAQEVATCGNGIELVKAVTDTYKARHVDQKEIMPLFAIIDLNMPVMDGITAARTIRQMEKQNDIEPLPFIFFSSVIANEKLKSAMLALAPAVYINKGNTPDIDALVARVNVLLNFIGEKYLSQ